MSGIDDLDDLFADILADEGSDEGAGNTDAFAGLFDSLDPNANPAADWSPLFSPNADDVSPRLRDDWTRAATLDPAEASWLALFTGVSADLNAADTLTAPNAPRDPFSDPLLNPFADRISDGDGAGTSALLSAPPRPEDGGEAFDVDSELARLVGLDQPGGASVPDAPPDGGAGRKDETSGGGLYHGHFGGAAAAVGLIGAGIAAPRPAGTPAPAAPGAGNMDDLDPPDDLDGNNFALFDEFSLDGDVALLRDGTERSGETARHVRISAAAWEDMANAAAALGARRGHAEGPDAAAAFLARVRQSLDMLVRYPEAGLPLPEAPAGLPALPADLTEARLFILTGAFPCDLYYRVLPDPDGPEGPETEALLVLRLLPSTASDEA